MTQRGFGTQLVAALFLMLVMANPGFTSQLESSDVGNKANFQSDVIYQILTDRFYDGDPSNNNPYNLSNVYDPDGEDVNRFFGGDWQGIIDKIDYLKNMGVTAIYISPPYDNLDEPYLENGIYFNAYHGFWAKDYFRASPYWGDLNKFDQLISTAHSNGIKVVIDFAPNHTNHRDSAEEGGFYKDGVFMAKSSNDPNGYFHHQGNRDNHETSRWDYQWKDLAHLSDLNQEHSTIVGYLFDAIEFWLDRGVDGVRNDAILHQNPAFLKTYTDFINNFEPVFHFGEFWVSKPDHKYEDYRTFQNRTGISVLDFEFANTMTNVFGNFSEDMYDFWTMIQYTADDYTYEHDAVTFIDNHDKPRLHSIQQNTDIAHAAIATLLTSRGVPIIYYGTEQYLEGEIGDAGRVPMPGYDNERTGLSVGWSETTTAYQVIKKLAELRSDNPALQYGTTTQRWINEDVFIFERQFFDSLVLVAVNRSLSSFPISGLFTNLPQGSYSDVLDGVLDGESITVDSQGTVNNFTLGPAEVGVWAHRNVSTSQPRIGTVGPTMGRPGTIVTIDGEGFGSVQETVRFDSTTASIQHWSNTHVKVEVPQMAAGVVDITVEAGNQTSNSYAYDVLSGEQVQVIFKVTAQTDPGENIYVVGNVHELDNWDADNVYMPFHNPNYPEWFLPVSVPAGTTLEFKFIKRDGNGIVTWESGSNRTFTTPWSGTADTPWYSFND